ncbi:MAG: cell division protein FtsA, partial [Chloroflexota bacterium]
MERTIVGIDVGTSKVCTLVGQAADGGMLRITGVGIVPSQGVRKGVITDLEEASRAIQESVQRAERVSGHTIAEAYVSVGGAHIASQNNHGAAAIGRGDRPVDRDDIARAMEAAQAIVLPHNRRIIHALPRSYSLDHQDGIHNPIGLMGYRLEVEAHMVTGAETSMQNLRRCVGMCGIEVTEMVLQPLAAAEAVLTEDERKQGVALVDIGGGTTDITLFVDGSAWQTVVCPIGGNHVTNDVAVGLRTPWATAEDVKTRYAQVGTPSVTGEVIEIATFGGSALQTISRQELCEIVALRAEEVVEMIGRELKRSGLDSLLSAGVVLTGGTAKLRGLRELAERRLGLPVRVGAPTGMQGLVEAISSPSYAASVGLLLWGMHQETTGREEVLSASGSSWRER